MFLLPLDRCLHFKLRCLLRYCIVLNDRRVACSIWVGIFSFGSFACDSFALLIYAVNVLIALGNQLHWREVSVEQVHAIHELTVFLDAGYCASFPHAFLVQNANLTHSDWTSTSCYWIPDQSRMFPNGAQFLPKYTSEEFRKPKRRSTSGWRWPWKKDRLSIQC